MKEPKPVPEEQFQKLWEAWRAKHPDPRQEYLEAIPKHVADSMALEGEHVSLTFLEVHLARI